MVQEARHRSSATEPKGRYYELRRWEGAYEVANRPEGGENAAAADDPLDTLATTDSISIQIILGSTREDRFGGRVANWFYGFSAKHEDLTAGLIDLRGWPLPFFNEPVSPITGRYAPEARARPAKIG